MALTKDQKTAQLQELTQQLKKAQSVMFAQYIGLTVGSVSQLRKKLREGKAEMKVAKKTLMEIAFKEAGYPELDSTKLEGPIACIFSFDDPLSGGRIAFTFGKTQSQVALVGGVFEGKLLSKEEAVELAMIPSRLELLSKFIGICASPLGSFAYGLKQIADKKEAPTEEKKNVPDETKTQTAIEATEAIQEEKTPPSSASSDSSASSASPVEEEKNDQPSS